MSDQLLSLLQAELGDFSDKLKQVISSRRDSLKLHDETEDLLQDLKDPSFEDPANLFEEYQKLKRALIAVLAENTSLMKENAELRHGLILATGSAVALNKTTKEPVVLPPQTPSISVSAPHIALNPALSPKNISYSTVKRVAPPTNYLLPFSATLPVQWPALFAPVSMHLNEFNPPKETKP